MSPDFFLSYGIFMLMCSYTYTTFDAHSNETKMSLLTAIVWDMLAFPAFLILQRSKNLKIAIASEILVIQYMMFLQFL